jgi:hypothetical protein
MTASTHVASSIEINAADDPTQQRGISRVPCVKCGAPSKYQWRICSTGAWTAVCRRCDITINRKIARWAFGKEAEPLLKRYEAKA